MNGTAAEPIVSFLSFASQMLTPEVSQTLMQGLAQGTLLPCLCGCKMREWFGTTYLAACARAGISAVLSSPQASG